MKYLVRVGIWLAFFFILFFVGVNHVKAAETVTTVHVKGVKDYKYIQEVFRLINEERKKQGLEAVTLDKDLTETAMQRAAEVSIYFSHERPDCTMYYSLAPNTSENIAFNQISPSEVMNNWMNSPGHRANILNVSHKAVGIGCFYSSNHFSWVQLFKNTPSAQADNFTETGVFDIFSINILRSRVILNASEDIFGYTQDKQSQMKVGDSGILYCGLYNYALLFGSTCYPSTQVKIYANIWMPAEDVSFSSSHPEIVSIDSEGYYKAVTAGTSVLKVSLKSDPDIFSEFTVTSVENSNALTPSDQSTSITVNNSSSEPETGKYFDDGEYELLILSSSTVKIANYFGDDSAISIPETVYYDGIPMTVTEIGEKVFYNKQSIISLTIPDSIRSIDTEAFSKCKNLQRITLGKNLQTINKYVFYKCISIKKIIFQCKKAPTIGKKTFSDVNKKVQIYRTYKSKCKKAALTKQFKNSGLKKYVYK